MPVDFQTQHIVVTGASGYIGAVLVEALLQHGAWVTVLGRSWRDGFRHSRLRFIDWNLTAALPEETFSSDKDFRAPTAIIHLAHDRHSPADEEENQNFKAAQELLVAARRHSIQKFVFCSSLSARADALNRYGRVKFHIETLLTHPGEVAVRVGMVYGGAERGLWGTLCALVRRTSILPLVQPNTLVQPIHVSETVMGLIRLATIVDAKKHRAVLAAPEPVPFQMCLREIARFKFGKSLKIIPVPLWLALSAVKLLNLLPFFPVIDKERLLGLAGLQTLESGSDLKDIGLILKPFSRGLSEETVRKPRPLLEEGRVLFKYALRTKPSVHVLKRYIRSLRAVDDLRPLKIPALIKICPMLMALIESFLGKANPRDLQRRLRYMLHVAETTPQGARAFYDYDGKGFLHVGFILCATALREAALLPIRLLKRAFK